MAGQKFLVRSTRLALVFNEAISLAAIAIQHHQALRNQLLRMWDRLTRGHTRIVVFGGAGAGKSSFGQLLAGKSLGRGEYRESTEIERYDIEGSTSCTVLVPPGQKRLREATWSGLEGLIASSPCVVVHVVDWGLDEVAPLTYRQLRTFAEGMDPRAALETFAAQQRAHELDPLERLAGVQPKDGTLRLVTVVSKQDLWWRWRDSVRAHYEEGAYAERLAALEERLGSGKLHHTLWSAAPIIKNFRDGEGNVLLPCSEGYDEPLRRWHEQRLVEIVGEAARNA